MSDQAPFDPHHPAIGTVQAWLTTGRHQTPDGDHLIATVRVPNATLTVVLSKADAQAWIKALQREVDSMSSLSLVPADAVLPPLPRRR